MTDYITLPISCKTVHKIINKCDYFINKILPRIGIIVLCGILLSISSITMGLTGYLATHPIIAATISSDSFYPDGNWIIYFSICFMICVFTFFGVFDFCDVKFTCIKEKKE